MTHSSHHEVRSAKNLVTYLILLISSFSSGFLTFDGLRLLQPLHKAVILAVAVAVIQYCGARYLALHYAKGDREDRHSLIRNIALPVVFCVLMTSTVTMFYSMAAPTAEKRAMAVSMEGAAADLERLKAQRKAEAPLGRLLRAEASGWKEKAEGARRGRFSGSSGRGKNYNDLKNLEHAYATAAKIVEDSQRRSSDEVARADLTLKEMWTLANTAASEDGKLEERKKGFVVRLRQMNGHMSALSQSSVRDALLIVDSGLSAQANAPSNARTEARREKEKEAAAAIGAMALESKRRIDQVARELSPETIAIPLLRLPQGFEAIAGNFEYVFLFAVFAFCIDIVAPLISIFMVSYLVERLPREAPLTVVAEARPERPNSEKSTKNGEAHVRAGSDTARILERLRKQRLAGNDGRRNAA